MREFIHRLMSFFFFHLYHSFAWSYDFVANMVSGGRWFEWGNSLSEFVLPDELILELGFGTGHFQEYLLQSGSMVIGIDESSFMAKITNRKLKDYSKKKLVRANALNLPFLSNQFDRIIANFPSEYIFQKVYLEEIRQLLNPGGRLIVLLGVQFTGSSMLDIMYKLIFYFSGQQVNENLIQQLINHGQFSNFKNVTLNEKMLKTHKLTILIAEK